MNDHEDSGGSRSQPSVADGEGMPRYPQSRNELMAYGVARGWNQKKVAGFANVSERTVRRRYKVPGGRAQLSRYSASGTVP